MRPRRFLPSLSQLLAFEAVIRHRSVTAAARELDLTQSTVSRLIQGLEAQIGRPLFAREHKKLIPNDVALSYQEEITRALDTIQRASMAVVANPEGGALNLSVLPTFATRWLAPRLSRFLSAHPGVSVNLTTRFDRFSFDAESFDAAIYFGAPSWPDAHHLRLFDESYIACASAEFLATNTIAAPSDLLNLPMLQLASRPDSWRTWFTGQGEHAAPVAGMVVDQFSMMIQAAISGLGVALLPAYLARGEIAAGRLFPLSFAGESSAAPGTYWLVWPERKNGYTPLTRFRDWIGHEATLASS